MSQIGPVLPPGWKPSGEDDGSDHSDRSASESPPDKSEDEVPSTSDDCYGPALPPDMLGPALPPDMVVGGGDHDEESDDDLPVGPAPESASESAEAYDYRLYKLRKEKEEEEELRKRKGRREEWMTELPSKLSKSYGLTARTFKKHDSGAGGDTSSWTETPEERLRNQDSKGNDKSKDEKTILHKAAAERDRKFDAEVEHLNAKRTKESLMELHTKKQKKDKEETEKLGKGERRPFDREKDMKIVNLKSSSERNKALDKMQQLGNRFGHGGDQKYL